MIILAQTLRLIAVPRDSGCAQRAGMHIPVRQKKFTSRGGPLSKTLKCYVSIESVNFLKPSLLFNLN